jgi:hypothetical protein
MDDSPHGLFDLFLKRPHSVIKSPVDQQAAMDADLDTLRHRLLVHPVAVTETQPHTAYPRRLRALEGA